MFKKRVRRNQPTKAKTRLDSDSENDTDLAIGGSHGPLQQERQKNNKSDATDAKVSFIRRKGRQGGLNAVGGSMYNKSGTSSGTSQSESTVGVKSGLAKIQRHLDAQQQTNGVKFTASDLGATPTMVQGNENAESAEKTRAELEQRLNLDAVEDRMSPEHDEWTNTDVINYQDEYLDTTNDPRRADIVRRREIQEAMDAAYELEQNATSAHADIWEQTQLKTAGDVHAQVVSDALDATELQFDEPLGLEQVRNSLKTQLEDLQDDQQYLAQKLESIKLDEQSVNLQMGQLEEQLVKWVQDTF